MEDYQSRQKYLFHLKKISEIKNTHRKPITITLRNDSSRILNASASSSPRTPDTHLQTSDRIMREYLQQKENRRLVERIANISSSIRMKKYSREYQHAKSLMRIHSRAKPNSHYTYFRFFDIVFQKAVSGEPEDMYRVYDETGGRKILLAHQSLFQLRKMKLRVKKGECLLRIQGKGEGQIFLKAGNLQEIVHRGKLVGNAIIEIGNN